MPRVPVRATPHAAGYSGTPLPRKLAIKEDTRVALVGAPPGFRNVIGEIPPGAWLRDGARGACDLMLCFCRSRADLLRHAKMIGKRGDVSRFWLIWPKQSSAIATDLKESDVREAGLRAGFVDYKVCAVDATWSGLLFGRRKANGSER